MPAYKTPLPLPWLVDARAGIDGTSDRPPWARLVDRPAEMLLLDRNENQDPGLAALIRSIVRDLPATVATDYGWADPVYRKLGDHLGVEPDQMMLAAGSEVSIRDIFATYIGAGDRILSPVPTYIMLEVFVRQFGASLIPCDYEASPEGPTLDVDRFCGMIGDAAPRMVYLPNPNSPTGTVVQPVDLRRITETAGRAGALMVVDEAYYPFHDFTALPWLREYPHLVITRTFSKAWGMAGLRLGLLLAQPGLMSHLHKLRPLNEAGNLTLAVLDRLLDNTDEIEKSVERLTKGKHYFCDEMHSLGFRVHPSHGNFCLVDFGEAEKPVLEALSGFAIFRKSPHRSMSAYQRISSTTVERFAPLVARIRQAVGTV